MQHRASTTAQRGFTLPEILITAALLGPVMIALFVGLERMHEVYRAGERRAELQQSARIVMARMSRELMSAGLDPSAVIPNLPIRSAIQTAEIARIAFVGDTNGDGTTEKIEYRLDLSADPPLVRRQQWSTWNSGWSGTNGGQPLAERIRSVEFTYVGSGGIEITPGELPARISEIRAVGIVIIAEGSSDQEFPDPYRLVSEIRLRNGGW